MTGFDDISKKAQELLKDEKVKKALSSEQAEGVSDSVFDGVAGAANKVTHHKFDSKVEAARKAADKRVGDK